ncbi:MAG TPA: F0F1 ATP synthase subunit A [Pirellulales bacterium]|nr:F0F1 ATP synthase subunit A [Pirellulales bacterium]
MADPVLHIKDAYYFEVPKFMWRYHYTSYGQVPHSMDFLVHDAEHQHLSIDEFNYELSGKILIPQPFATLKNLYEKQSGFAISKFMVLELLAAVVLSIFFIRLGQRMKAGVEPRGRWWNLLESMLVFIRDQVVRPSIGGHDEHDEHDGGPMPVQTHYDQRQIPGNENADDPFHDHGNGHGRVKEHEGWHPNPADKFLPLFWTMFFFILGCNLLGLIPWLGAPTGAFGATFGFACVTFATTILAGSKKFGPIGFWFNQVPSMELPWYMWPLKIVIFLIEVLGLFIKHAILSVRLLANMVAGHLVLLGIMGLIAGAAAAGTGTWTTVTFISVVSSTLFSLLELFVAFLQAYIFTFLSALFIGAAVHRH